MSGAITDSCLLAQRGVRIEFELLVLTHRVQHDTGVGLVDSGIIQEALDLVVHVLGVSELPDRDDIEPTRYLVNRENLAAPSLRTRDIARGCSGISGSGILCVLVGTASCSAERNTWPLLTRCRSLVVSTANSSGRAATSTASSRMSLPSRSRTVSVARITPTSKRWSVVSRLTVSHLLHTIR